MIKPEHSRAARGWLDWTQDELATLANVGVTTVADFEKEKRTPIDNNVAAIRRAFEKAGVIFEADGKFVGVKIKKRAR